MIRSSARRGFTLLEVMVTVGIIAIVTGLAVSGGSAMVAAARMSGEAEVLASFLRNTGLRAISTGCAHKVRYRGRAYTVVPATAGRLEAYRVPGCQLNNQSELMIQSNDTLVSMYPLTSGISVTIGGTDYAADTTNGFLIGFQPTGGVLTGIDVNNTSVGTLAISTISIKSTNGNASPRTVTLRGANNVALR